MINILVALHLDIIKFKLCDMDEVYDENEEFFDGHRDYYDTEAQEKIHL